MPVYEYQSDSGDSIERWFSAKDAQDGIVPQTILENSTEYRRVFSLSSTIFVESMERAENMEILKAMDHIPNQMVLENGRPTGKSNAQLASEGILKPLASSKIES